MTLLVGLVLILVGLIAWNICIWGYIIKWGYRRYKRHRLETEIERLNLILRERAEDSGNESNGEEEERLEQLIHNYNHNNHFANPMFDL
ncbi:unnamed protein product [Simian immunodeficiency virus]|uniref:Protein Vpu n=1 Tax=Simian immunodeficiency virus (isolate CPZ GAB1) TaxID=402771 RepID=VPU_SIVCZ|nr:RecName: Full=Protein Vpu; AltName: Full=U ORF protein; AltName: Full=Viral protein U [SIVcpz GAB1]CAA36406.1 unnamed protein product [Simian immunodeficiency virus]